MASDLRPKLEFVVTVAVLIALAAFSLAHSPSRNGEDLSPAVVRSASK